MQLLLTKCDRKVTEMWLKMWARMLGPLLTLSMNGERIISASKYYTMAARLRYQRFSSLQSRLRSELFRVRSALTSVVTIQSQFDHESRSSNRNIEAVRSFHFHRTWDFVQWREECRRAGSRYDRVEERDSEKRNWTDLFCFVSCITVD